MEPIKIVIIDDEAPARELLKHHLKDYPQLVVAGEADNGFDGMKLIKEQKPDLIFLDIQMPKLTGFEMLELMEGKLPEIIFSTAFDQYALRAFDLNAVDYLLKPYAKDRFNAAIQKALIKRHSENNQEHLQSLKKTIEAQTETLTRVAVKDRQQIHVIPTGAIHYIEADGDYVKLHTDRGAFLKEKTMKYFEASLPPQFIRIHRSFIVNIDEVAKIELYEKETYRVYLKNGEQLKASSSGYKLLKETVKL